MNFNSIVFLAPTYHNQSSLIEDFEFKDQLLFVPKTKPQDENSNLNSNLLNSNKKHIPCLYQESLSNPYSSKLFLYFHGNAEDIFNSSSTSNIVKTYLPFNALSVEYPGYSIYYEEKSAETIEEDSLILFDFLVKELQINPKNIIICGRSIGSGPATYLAAKRKPGALILISPIKSIRDTVNGMVGPMKYLVKNRFNNYERIKEVTCPLLVIHGQKDNLIPYKDAIDLAERTSGPYELVLPENMTHNQIHVFEDFLEPIRNFLKRYNLINKNKNVKKDRIKIDRKYFTVPEYILMGKHCSNGDTTSDFVRKIIGIS